MELGKDEINDNLLIGEDSVEEEGVEESSLLISNNLLPCKYAMNIKDDD